MSEIWTARRPGSDHARHDLRVPEGERDGDRLAVGGGAMITELRDLPRMDHLLADPRLAALPRELVREEARAALEGLRARLRAGEAVDEGVAEAIAARVQRRLAPVLVPVLNATGVVLHTNLGRAPWSEAAVAAAAAVARGYCNLEVDLQENRRGGRADGARALLQRLTGAEDALVVNNGAAAVLLALTALAAGGEVVVSRGELVEIGGSFRVPDVITACGARLVEVGTTNRTRTADFERAVGPSTRVLLAVHPSNFRVEGFVEAAPWPELVALARARGLRAVYDAGSGSLRGEGREPGIAPCVAAGADLVTFSGDKLLGGPQAGVIVGRAEVVGLLRRHPLYRALRVDKVTLAALEATLRGWVTGDLPPVRRMLDQSPAALRPRAEALAARLQEAGIAAEVRELVGLAGGGSLPGEGLPSVGVAVRGRVDALARALRRGAPPVLARVADEAVLLDLRTVLPEQEPALAACVIRAARLDPDPEGG